MHIPLEKDLDEFKDNWNSHLIRKNVTGFPGRVPNKLYQCPSLHGKKRDKNCFGYQALKLTFPHPYCRINKFDANIWLNAMVRESEAPLPFCSASFKVWADNILKRDVNLSQENILSHHAETCTSI